MSSSQEQMKKMNQSSTDSLDDGGASNLMAELDPTGGMLTDPIGSALGDSTDNTNPTDPNASSQNNTDNNDTQMQEQIDANSETVDESFDMGKGLGQSIMSLGTGDTIANAAYNPSDAMSSMMSPSMANSSDTDGGEKDLDKATSQMDSSSKSNSQGAQQMIEKGVQFVEENPEVLAAVL
jgi:hypothetical protein